MEVIVSFFWCVLFRIESHVTVVRTPYFPCIINYLTSWKVHRKIREDTDMAQDSLQCLAQLASLHGPVFPDEGSQVDYLAHFIEGLLNTINGYVCLLSKFRWHLLIFRLECSVSVWRPGMACLFLGIICAYCWITEIKKRQFKVVASSVIWNRSIDWKGINKINKSIHFYNFS